VTGGVYQASLQSPIRIPPKIQPPMAGIDFLRPELVVAEREITSRKRLFEYLSALISGVKLGQDRTIDQEEIFTTLHDRERLGCTALGQGIAVPHGRLDGLVDPIMAIVSLKDPIDYDAADGVPVWLVVCLLVPIEASELHLNLLASLVTRFEDDRFVVAVKATRTNKELYDLFSAPSTP